MCPSEESKTASGTVDDSRKREERERWTFARLISLGKFIYFPSV
jgi:hypothetical protein